MSTIKPAPLKNKVDKWVNDPENKSCQSFSYEDVAAAVEWLNQKIKDGLELSETEEEKDMLRTLKEWIDAAFPDVREHSEVEDDNVPPKSDVVVKDDFIDRELKRKMSDSEAKCVMKAFDKKIADLTEDD